jgi:hypothetical protein
MWSKLSLGDKIQIAAGLVLAGLALVFPTVVLGKVMVVAGVGLFVHVLLPHLSGVTKFYVLIGLLACGSIFLVMRVALPPDAIEEAHLKQPEPPLPTSPPTSPTIRPSVEMPAPPPSVIVKSKSNPAPQTQPATRLTQNNIQLSVVIISPKYPALVVENVSDAVADGVRWQLIMFRTTDLAFFSWPAKDIGYIKARSKTAPFFMELNPPPHVPGVGDIPGGWSMSNGDNLIGSLIVDCALCKGATFLVSFTWGISGWFYEVPNYNAQLLIPNQPWTKETVSLYIETLNSFVKPQERRPIM